MIITEDSPGVLTCELTVAELEAWNVYDSRDYKDSHPKQRPLMFRAARTAEARKCTKLYIVAPDGADIAVAQRNRTECWEWGHDSEHYRELSIDQKYGLSRR